MSTVESRTPLGVAHWAAEQRMRDHGLTPAHGNALRALADFANRDGVCIVGVKRLAEILECSRGHAHRLVGDLERVGLIGVVRRRGHRPSVRRLMIDAPPLEQLRLLSPNGSEAPSDVTPDVTLGGASMSHLDRRSVTSRCDTKSLKGTTAAAGARESVEDQAALVALSSKLPEVLEILRAAPGLVVEPAAVHSALSAYPESAGHDHVRAAHTVASYANEPLGLAVPVANRLLMTELRKQGEADAKLLSRGRRADGRAPTPAAGSERREPGRIKRSLGW